MISILNESLNTIKRCGDHVDKTIMGYKMKKNNVDGIPEDEFKKIHHILQDLRMFVEIIIDDIDEEIDDVLLWTQERLLK